MASQVVGTIARVTVSLGWDWHMFMVGGFYDERTHPETQQPVGRVNFYGGWAYLSCTWWL